MKPSLLLVPLLFSLLLRAGMVIRNTGRSTAVGPVYSVAKLQVRLAARPAAWVDRPPLVRARAESCSAWIGLTYASPCLNWQPALTDTQARDSMEALPLAPGPVPPLLAMLRHLPLIGSVVLAPQQPHWNASDVYRIQLHGVSGSLRDQQARYEALLLDAAGDMQTEANP